MTSLLCVLCAARDREQQSAPGHNTCLRCRDHLTQLLREIVEYTAALNPTPGVGGSGRRAPGFGSRPPANLHIIAALDKRTVPYALPAKDAPEDLPSDVWSILGTLYGLTRFVRKERGLLIPLEPPTVTGEVRFLVDWMDWCTAQPWIEDVAEDIRELHRQVRASALMAPDKPVGSCLSVECGGPVFQTRDGSLHRCSRCRREYDGSDLVKLRINEETG